MVSGSSGAPSGGYVDGEWKYIRHYKKPHPFQSSAVDMHSGKPMLEMLFSLKDDPAEMNNRINDPELGEKAAELRQLCDEDLTKLLKIRKDYGVQYQLKE